MQNSARGISTARVRSVVVAAIASGILVFTLSGCAFLSSVFGIAPKLTILQGSTNLSANGSKYDFGAVDPASSTGSTVSFTIRNDDNYNLSVDSISVSDTADYSVGFTKLSLDPGATGTYSLTFKPATSGQKDATVTITSGSNSAKLSVTGDGNSAPVVTFQLVLTGTDSVDTGGFDLNGTYTWDWNTGQYGSYVLNASTPFYVWMSSGANWDLANAPDESGVPVINFDSTYNSPQYDGWVDYTNQGVTPPTVDSTTTSGIQDQTNPTQQVNSPIANGDVLIVNYHYSDADADPVNGAGFAYEWQGSTDPLFGTTTILSTASTYTVNSADFTGIGAYYLRVIITPAATAGVKTGAKTASPPFVVRKNLG